jgi:transcriptional regulator with XRE-family HTH domain
MESESWVFRVKAYEGESLGHFLGRFRRANELSHKAIADHLGVRVAWAIAWESPSRRRNPTDLKLLALSRLAEVDCKRLKKMLPPSRFHLQKRVCAAGYSEVPVWSGAMRSSSPALVVRLSDLSNRFSDPCLMG